MNLLNAAKLYTEESTTNFTHEYDFLVSFALLTFSTSLCLAVARSRQGVLLGALKSINSYFLSFILLDPEQETLKNIITSTKTLQKTRWKNKKKKRRRRNMLNHNDKHSMETPIGYEKLRNNGKKEIERTTIHHTCTWSEENSTELNTNTCNNKLTKSTRNNRNNNITKFTSIKIDSLTLNELTFKSIQLTEFIIHIKAYKNDKTKLDSMLSHLENLISELIEILSSCKYGEDHPETKAKPESHHIHEAVSERINVTHLNSYTRLNMHRAKDNQHASGNVLQTTQPTKRKKDTFDDHDEELTVNENGEVTTDSNDQNTVNNDTYVEYFTNNRALRTQDADEAEEEVLKRLLAKKITNAQDKAEIERRVNIRIEENKILGQTVNRAAIAKEVRAAFLIEKGQLPCSSPNNNVSSTPTTSLNSVPISTNLNSTYAFSGNDSQPQTEHNTNLSSNAKKLAQTTANTDTPDPNTNGENLVTEVSGQFIFNDQPRSNPHDTQLNLDSHDHTNRDNDEADTNDNTRTQDYEAKSYCVRIYSSGLNNPKYVSNVVNRFREIKRRTNTTRILSSSIQKCSKTKKTFSKVVTDCLDDYKKLLDPWPTGSFDSDDTVTIEKEYVEVNVQILDVPKDAKIELDRNTLDSLREQGLRNIKRSTRFDMGSQKQVELNRLQANVKDFDTLKKLFEEGVALQCLKTNHDVEPMLEFCRICKSCCMWEHRTKNCENRKRCIRCSESGHDFTECPNPSKLKCAHCGLSHEAGSFKCRVTYEKNVEKNKFFCEFMVKENLRSNYFAVLNCPVPDGMHVDEEMLLNSDQHEEQKNEIYDTIDAYMRNIQSKIDPELRKDIDNLKARVDNHEDRISLVENDIKKMDENIHSLRNELVEKTEAIIEQVRENNDHLKEIAEEMTVRLMRSELNREKELKSLKNEFKSSQDNILNAILSLNQSQNRVSGKKHPERNEPTVQADSLMDSEEQNQTQSD